MRKDLTAGLVTTSLIAAVLALGPMVVRGQSLRGTVREASGRAPIAGAVILLVADSSTILARTITDTHGHYGLERVHGATLLRVLHIGYRPGNIRLAAAADTALTIDVSLDRLATLLQPVRITGRRDCPARADDGAMLALLDQVRAGVLATEVAGQAKPAFMVRLVYKRELDDNDEITEQSVRAAVDRSAESFKAVRTAQQFVETGFLRDSAGVHEFFAPDAATIVDPSFAAGYCFRITTSEMRPRQVGLAFSPAKDRRDVVQIAGTLWTDTARRTLSDLDFSYMHLDPPMQRATPGGRIAFQELANGIVLVHRWSLRLPAARQETPPGFPTGGQVRTWYYAEETGGRVASAEWPDGYLWTAPLGQLRVHLTDRAGKPLSGAMATVQNTTYRSVTDSEGNATIRFLLTGPWRLIVLDSAVADLPIAEPPIVDFEAQWGTTTFDTITVENLAGVTAKAFCPHGLRGNLSSVVVGRIVSESTARLDSVNVRAEWTLPNQSGSTDGLPMAVRSNPSQSGIYAICGLPASTTIQISAERGADTARSVTLRTPGTRTLLRLDLPLPQRTRATRPVDARTVMNAGHP